ncbi:MAG: hypothetical protein GY903_07250 [Fuerstiella sp.]|nr:hypothetical protein [Fuerstiella sp.]
MTAASSGWNPADVPRPSVDGQPLAANAARLLEALEYLGHPLPEKTILALRTAIHAESSNDIQQLLDQHVLFAASINPELRVKVGRGPADPVIQQAGFTPVLVKVINDATVTRRLQISSPQAGPGVCGHG